MDVCLYTASAFLFPSFHFPLGRRLEMAPYSRRELAAIAMSVVDMNSLFLCFRPSASRGLYSSFEPAGLVAVVVVVQSPGGLEDGRLV